MSRAPHLFVALSGHGFGHLAQVAPVLTALRRRLPGLRLTVQCALPEAILRSRIAGSLDPIAEATDFGMMMANAMDVELAASVSAYRAFHADWQSRLARQQRLLADLEPDLVLADIPYLPLAAAAGLGIPAVALCSLNWAAILSAYCGADPGLAGVRELMLDAYHSAAVFLCPAPSMPMPDLANTRSIGPIATLGRNRRTEINARFGLAGDEILVLAGLGGIDFRLPMDLWPPTPGIRWLVPAAWQVNRPGVFYREAVAEIDFIDLLHSCDVLLTKSGYGAFVEAACNGKPVLYVKRSDWPEEPGLSRWLRAHGNALRIDRNRLMAGDLLDSLPAVLAQPRRPAVAPAGIEEAVSCLTRCLERL